KRHLSFVKQNNNFLMQMSIYENIIFGTEDSEELRGKVEALSREYGISEIFKDENYLDIQVLKGCQNLSGGQKQCVHLLRAIIIDSSKVLILDEPTSALDSNSQDNIIRLIKDIN